VLHLVCGCVLGLCHVSGYLGNHGKSLSGWFDEGFDEAQISLKLWKSMCCLRLFCCDF
jgi:hypothetical protein